MEKLKKLLDKKKKMGHELDPMDQEAKANVLKDLKSIAQEEMGKRLQGMKKVTVASDSKEGLEKGLDKAKEIMGHMPEDKEAPESSLEHNEDQMGEAAEEAEDSYGHEENGKAYEGEETPEEEAAEEKDEFEHMSEEDLDKKIQELMALKNKKKQ